MFRGPGHALQGQGEALEVQGPLGQIREVWKGIKSEKSEEITCEREIGTNFLFRVLKFSLKF